MSSTTESQTGTLDNQLPTSPQSQRARPVIDSKIFKAHTQISAWKSLVLIAGLYLLTFALAFVGGEFSGWWLALPAIALIAGIQNHLLILLHEGAHGLVFPNKKWNDLLTDITCAIPTGGLVRNYRHFHLTHHRNTGDPETDPEVPLYASQNFYYQRRPLLQMLGSFVLDVSGINFLRFFWHFNLFFWNEQKKGKNHYFTLTDSVLYTLVWGSAIAASLHFGVMKEFLIFWVLPQPTFLFFYFKLHGYGEHTGAEGPTEFERSFVHDFSPVTNFFLYPIKSGYHLEHHLYPTVPWYNMESFRAYLMSNPDYEKRADLVTVEGFFFGRRTIWKSLLVGTGRLIDGPIPSQINPHRSTP